MAPKKDNKDQQKSGKKNASGQQQSKTIETSDKAVRAVVEEIVGRAGTRGEALQVVCKILDGRDTEKRMRRNVKGPVRIDDILMLRETEIEASKLRMKGRK